MPRQPSFLTDEAGATGSWSRGGEPGGGGHGVLLDCTGISGAILPKIPNLACGKYDPKTRRSGRIGGSFVRMQEKY